jgi:hypothetical protein
VTSLNFEVNLLQRRLKIAEGEKTTANDSYQMSHQAADAEVDAMLGMGGVGGGSGGSGGMSGTGGIHMAHSKPESAITFEKWKMDQFLYSPDTPAASEQHDKQVVQMLLAAATQDFNDDYTKPTKSGIAKMRRPTSSLQGGSPLKPLSSSGNRGGGGADLYETMGVGFLADPEAVPSYNAHGGGDANLYFLDRSPHSMWGHGQGGKASSQGQRKTMGKPLTAQSALQRGESRSPNKSKKVTGINSMIV